MLADALKAELVPTATRSVPRLLVVDDEDSVLQTIQGVLQLDGYDVIATGSGREALNLVRSEPFDLVLIDLRLDDLDGIELMRELRRSSPDAACIMLTGYASVDSAIQALREGAYDYLVKPCDVVELRATVGRALDRRRLQLQLQERLRELEEANATIRALNLELEQRVEAATAELRQQINARDEFMATVSHDLKSPITFIKGLSNLRRRRAPLSDETLQLLDALEQIEAAAGRMAHQLDGLVDATRLESGRPLELRRDPTDLVELVRKAVEEHRQTSDWHVIDVTSTHESVVGNWDAGRLERVLDNLIGNAIKYSPRGGSIEVNVELAGDDQERWAVLSVTDHGEGIPESDLPHVFERFRRGKNVEGRIPGTGIGLSGVRRIIEQHGGNIDVESTVGHGTTFTVLLPV